MKEKLSSLPEPIQKQILIRLGFGAVFLLLFVVVLAMSFDWLTVVPFIILALASVLTAIHLFYQALAGNYVVVKGVCEETAVTPLRKRTKSILLKTEEASVRIKLRQRLRKIPVGSNIVLYIAASTPVYERDGEHHLYSYIAIDIKGGNAK